MLIYMENVDPASRHNKFYLVASAAHGERTEMVSVWGPRGRPTGCDFTITADARAALQVVDSKQRKGYVTVATAHAGQQLVSALGAGVQPGKLSSAARSAVWDQFVALMRADIDRAAGGSPAGIPVVAEIAGFRSHVAGRPWVRCLADQLTAGPHTITPNDRFVGLVTADMRLAVSEAFKMALTWRGQDVQFVHVDNSAAFGVTEVEMAAALSDLDGYTFAEAVSDAALTI